MTTKHLFAAALLLAAAPAALAQAPYPSRHYPRVTITGDEIVVTRYW